MEINAEKYREHAMNEARKNERIESIRIRMIELRRKLESEFDKLSEEEKKALEDERFALQQEFEDLSGMEHGQKSGPFYEDTVSGISEEEKKENQEIRNAEIEKAKINERINQITQRMLNLQAERDELVKNGRDPSSIRITSIEFERSRLQKEFEELSEKIEGTPTNKTNPSTPDFEAKKATNEHGEPKTEEDEKNDANIRKVNVDTAYAIGPIRAFFLKIVRKLKSLVKNGGILYKVLSGTESGLLIGTKKVGLTAGKNNVTEEKSKEDKKRDTKPNELEHSEKVKASDAEKITKNMTWIFETLKKDEKEITLLQKTASDSLNSLKVDGKNMLEKNGADKADKAGVPKVSKGKRFVDWVLFDTSKNIMKMAQEKGIKLINEDGSDRDIASVYEDLEKAVNEKAKKEENFKDDANSKKSAYKNYMNAYDRKMKGKEDAKGEERS